MVGSRCASCDATLWVKNTCGYCRLCWGKHSWKQTRARDPEAFEAKRVKGIRSAIMADPERLDTLRTQIRAIRNVPGATEARSAAAKRARIWELSSMSQHGPGSAKRRAAAVKQSATRLAWCPPHLREEYRRLAFSKKYGAAAARAMILDQHEAELRRFRAERGLSAPAPEPAVPAFTASGNAAAPEWNERVEAHRSEKARVDALRQSRSLCGICGARSDLGCEHGAAA